MPALVSTNVAGQVDDTFTVTLGNQQVELHQIAVATQFPSTIPNAPFVVVPTRALLERELAVPEPGITLDEVWAMGPTDPQPALRERGFIPGRDVQQAEPIEETLAQLPQSLAVGMNFTAAAGGVGLGSSAFRPACISRNGGATMSRRAPSHGAERSQIRRTLFSSRACCSFARRRDGLGYLMLRLVMPYIGRAWACPSTAPA
jgi:hypothetical protein